MFLFLGGFLYLPFGINLSCSSMLYCLGIYLLKYNKATNLILCFIYKIPCLSNKINEKMMKSKSDN